MSTDEHCADEAVRTPDLRIDAASSPERSDGRANGRSRRLRVAVLVPVFDGEQMLDACLDALLDARVDEHGNARSDAHTDARDDMNENPRVDAPEHAATPLLQVLVVDDGSRDASVAVANHRAAISAGRVQVLALGRNHGFAGAINRGASLVLSQPAPPDVLVLVNQDCIVSPGWLEPLLAALDDPAVAMAGARLLEDDGITLQHAGARIEANGLTSHLGRGCRDARAWREAADVDYVCAALAAIRTDTWRRFGPFDEGYRPAYFEEVDFCVRARRAGLRVVFVPASEARHREASCSVAGSRTFLRRYHRSRMRFVASHLLGGAAGAAWLRAEVSWLLRLRRWSEIAPVLAAYGRLPRLLFESARGRRPGESVAVAVARSATARGGVS